jgi:hypothetical protein
MVHCTAGGTGSPSGRLSGFDFVCVKMTAGAVLPMQWQCHGDTVFGRLYQSGTVASTTHLVLPVEVTLFRDMCGQCLTTHNEAYNGRQRKWMCVGRSICGVVVATTTCMRHHGPVVV